jgi:glycosyltransferase involved in cell wall biosynthesis
MEGVDPHRQPCEPRGKRVVARADEAHATQAVVGAQLGEAVSVPGFVDLDELDALFVRAGCVVAPSVRDGYGMVVAEAAAAGTPVVVCRSPDSAAIERVEEGVNGTVAARATPFEIGEGIGRVLAAGEELRASTRSWFADNRERLSIAGSIARVENVYRQDRAQSQPRRRK